MTCCNGGRDGDPGCGKDPSAGVVALHFPYFCFQGVFILYMGVRDQIFLYQWVNSSPTQGDAQIIEERGFVRHLIRVSVGEIGDVPLSNGKEKSQASCVFRGLFENLRAPLISHLVRILSSLFD